MRCAAAWSFSAGEHVVFASDAPLGPIPPTIKTIEALELAPEARRKLYCGNAEKLLNMTF